MQLKKIKKIDKKEMKIKFKQENFKLGNKRENSS